MCNIPDYQTRGMPESFRENQRKTSLIPIFHFWVFRFYEILTFECKFDRMHIAIEPPFTESVSLKNSPYYRCVEDTFEALE